MTTGQAITTALKTVDGPYERQWHDGHRLPRTSSLQPRLEGKVISELNKMLTAIAFCVPRSKVYQGWASRHNGIKKTVKQASEGILGYTEH